MIVCQVYADEFEILDDERRIARQNGVEYHAPDAAVPTKSSKLGVGSKGQYSAGMHITFIACIRYLTNAF